MKDTTDYKNVRILDNGDIKFKLISSGMPKSTITIIDYKDSEWEWKWTYKMEKMDYDLHCKAYEIVKRVRRNVMRNQNKYEMTVTFNL
jgi:hypothetical protein